MAFTQANLKKIAGGGDQNVFLYNSADAVGTIAGSGYFNNATNQLHQNDIIITVGSTGCLLYTSPSPRDKRQSRMPSSA